MPSYTPTVIKNEYLMFTTSTEELSDHMQEISLILEYDDINDDRMGITAHSHIPGLLGWRVEGTMIQNFASTGGTAGTGIDKLIYSKAGGASFTIAVRPVNAARTSDNPEYTGPVVLLTHNPIAGRIGSLAVSPLRFMGSGNLTRIATSS